MGTIELRNAGITNLGTEAVVNAANEGLWMGGGVCGAIFRAAGQDKLTAACSKIGYCRTGSAVITPGFALCDWVIHAVGPQWQGGNSGEPQQLYGAYRRSLELAMENGIRSIGFPLISAGIFGYPLDKAWRKAIQACDDFLRKNPDTDLQIVFAIPDPKVLAEGMRTLREIAPDLEA